MASAPFLTERQLFTGHFLTTPSATLDDDALTGNQCQFIISGKQGEGDGEPLITTLERNELWGFHFMGNVVVVVVVVFDEGNVVTTSCR